MTKELSTQDIEDLRKLYKQSIELAKSFTVNDPKLFKTTFQCLFWEGCHYVFRLKLREDQKMEKMMTEAERTRRLEGNGSR